MCSREISRFKESSTFKLDHVGFCRLVSLIRARCLKQSAILNQKYTLEALNRGSGRGGSMFSAFFFGRFAIESQQLPFPLSSAATQASPGSNTSSCYSYHPKTHVYTSSYSFHPKHQACSDHVSSHKHKHMKNTDLKQSPSCFTSCE